jgi:hypothetical protein
MQTGAVLHPPERKNRAMIGFLFLFKDLAGERGG